MNRKIIYICCLFCIGDLRAEDSNNEILRIESEIKGLKNQLHQRNLLQMKEEVKGQEDFIANWEAYSQDLELIRKQEKEDNEIEFKIKNLEEQKTKLLKKNSLFNLI